MYFEFLDLIEFENAEFIVLLPVEDADGGVVILKLESTYDPEIEICCSVEDEQLLNQVFSIFKEEFLFLED